MGDLADGDPLVVSPALRRAEPSPFPARQQQTRVTPSRHSHIERLDRIKKELHVNFHGLTKEYAKLKKLSGAEAPPMAASSPSSGSPTDLHPLAKWSTFSLYQQLQTGSMAATGHETLASGVQGQARLFVNAHRLLLRYESVIRELGDLLASKEELSGSSSIEIVDRVLALKESLEAHGGDLAKDAGLLLSMLKSLLGASANAGPVRFVEECALCHHTNQIYDEDCQERFGRQRNVLLIKKAGNQLVRRLNQGLSERLSGSGEDDKQRTIIAMKRQRIELYKKALERIRADNAADQAAVVSMKSRLERQRARNEALRRLIESRQAQLDDLHRNATTARTRRAVVSEEYAKCRVEKIGQLMAIMPLNASDKKPNSVTFMNTNLPELFTEFFQIRSIEKQILVAAALGNLVRFLQILAHVLNVKLPFEMVYAGSASTIATIDGSSKGVLSELLVPREKFSSALMRLAFNVYYLGFQQGLLPDGQNPERNLMRNLRVLLQHEHLGKLPPVKFVRVSNTAKPSRPKTLTPRNSSSNLAASAATTPASSANSSPSEPKPDGSTLGDDDDLADFVQVDLPPEPV